MFSDLGNYFVHPVNRSLIDISIVITGAYINN